jgi:hypothetical protein
LLTAVVSRLVTLGVVLALAPSGAQGQESAPRVVVQVRQEGAPSVPGRLFTEIAPALASIADASPAKPYLVRLGPGVYGVPPRGLVLKPFVDIEGEGPGTSVIEGAIATETALWTHPLAADQPAVVRMAPNSRLLHLTVRNTSAAGGIAIYFPMTAAAGAADVTAEALGATGSGAQYDYQAIRVEGPGGDVTLDGVTARYRMEVLPGHQLVGDNCAIGVFSAGKLLVRNSRAIAENGWWNIGIASQRGSECVVQDTIIDVDGLAEGSYALEAGGARNEIRNVRMTVNCPSSGTWGCAAVSTCDGGTATIHDSDLHVIPNARAAGASLLKCEGTASSSRLTGPAAYDAWKLVECTDGQSRPIPNRP